MTIPRMEALNKAWRILPPLAESLYAIAASLGFKGHGGKGKAAEKLGTAEDLIRELGAAGVKVNL